MKTADILKATFDSRQSYLDWRAEWRRIYAEISEDIRILKQVVADDCRNPNTNWIADKDGQSGHWERLRPSTEAEIKRQERAKPAYERAREAYQNGFKGLRGQATALLAKRRWSKQESQRQYLAQHLVAA